MQILIGLLIMVGGIFFTIKAEWFYQNFGSISFMDKYFGSEGGGRLGYKLIGVLIAFFGMLIFTNMIGGFISWLLSPVLKFMIPGGA